MQVQVGEYVLDLLRGEQPIAQLLDSPGLVEIFGDLKGRTDEEGELLGVDIRGRGLPQLVVVQRFTSHDGIFEPGLLLVPETDTLLIGAGTRLLAYDLRIPRRLWEEVVEYGFFSWERAGEVVLMSAELELAAWTTDGRKLWTTFVEPPWSYSRDGDDLELDVMGNVSHFPILTGPSGKEPDG